MKKSTDILLQDILKNNCVDFWQKNYINVNFKKLNECKFFLEQFQLSHILYGLLKGVICFSNSLLLLPCSGDSQTKVIEL